MPYRSHHAPLSPTQRRKLLIGGALLAGSAGFVNAVLLTFFQVPVSHMSGAVSHLGASVGAGLMAQAAGALGVIAAFFLGSATSGAIIGRDLALPGRRHGVALLVESAALAAAAGCLHAHRAAGVPLAAFACGVQNATTSSYYGLALRTTHVTGMVTDLGVIVGQWFRHRRIPRWKATVYGVIASAFLLGCVLGAASIHWLDYRVLYVPAAGTFAAGIAYYVRAAARATAAASESAGRRVSWLASSPRASATRQPVSRQS